jgi:hypothetical protein
MKKTVMVYAVVVALISTTSCGDNQHEGKIVLYPTTEPVTDSFAIESTATVWKATVHVKGHLSDTMYISFNKARDNFRNDETLIGDIDTVYSNDWYNDKLHFQYYSNSVTEGDSVVMTCEFAR